MHGQLSLREMVELRAGEQFFPKSLPLVSCPNLVGPRRKRTSVPSYAMHGQLRLREMVELRAGEQFFPKSLPLVSCPNLVGPRRKRTSVPSYAMHGQLRLRRASDYSITSFDVACRSLSHWQNASGDGKRIQMSLAVTGGIVRVHEHEHEKNGRYESGKMLRFEITFNGCG